MLYRASNKTQIEARVKTLPFLEQLAEQYAECDDIASKCAKCIELIEKAEYCRRHFVDVSCKVVSTDNEQYELEVDQFHVMNSISGAYKYTYRKDYGKEDAFELTKMLDEICFALRDMRKAS